MEEQKQADVEDKEKTEPESPILLGISRGRLQDRCIILHSP